MISIVKLLSCFLLRIIVNWGVLGHFLFLKPPKKHQKKLKILKLRKLEQIFKINQPKKPYF